MSAAIFSAGSYWFCPKCRETSEVYEFRTGAQESADRHDAKESDD